jgi:hypothetical protein
MSDTDPYDEEASAGMVDFRLACPGCGERMTDRLVWQDDEKVLCTTWGRTSRPGEA